MSMNLPVNIGFNTAYFLHSAIDVCVKKQGVFVKHYGMPPAATKSKKLFLASRSK